MPSKITVKTVLYLLLFINMTLGRPQFALDSDELSFQPSRHNRNSHKVKVPPYMMQLYQTLMGEHKDISRPKYRILEESDMIESLPAKSCNRKYNRWSVAFDLTSISKEDELRLVELRVLLPPFKIPTNITVKIYHTTDGQYRAYLGSIIKNMPLSPNSAWQSFNVTNIIGQYLHKDQMMTNHKGIHVPRKPNSPNEFNFQYSRKPAKNLTPLQKTSSNKAIIVFFSKDKPFSKTKSPGLIKKLSERSAKKIAGFQKKRRNRNNRQIITPTSSYYMPEEEQVPLCRKVDMMVDIKELGWDNWVVYPKKYNAYRCEGSCRIPLRDTIKKTNYDYVKSFVNLKEWERSECSACVPVKMQPLSMLLHEGSDLVLRHREDMIIEECGVL